MLIVISDSPMMFPFETSGYQVLMILILYHLIGVWFVQTTLKATVLNKRPKIGG